jgi:hypothetical protein
MTEERTIIEKRDAAGFENLEGIKLSVLRKILLKAEVVKRQQWVPEKNRLGFYLLNSENNSRNFDHKLWSMMNMKPESNNYLKRSFLLSIKVFYTKNYNYWQVFKFLQNCLKYFLWKINILKKHFLNHFLIVDVEKT